MIGSIYFIETESRRWLKIGYATNVKTRLHNMQSGCPEHLSIEAVIPGTFEDEQGLHSAIPFKHRKRGEWYHRTELIQLLLEKAISGSTVADLIDFAKHPEPADDESMKLERRKLQYSRWIHDPTVPENWRKEYRKRLFDDHGIVAADSMVAASLPETLVPA